MIEQITKDTHKDFEFLLEADNHSLHDYANVTRLLVSKFNEISKKINSNYTEEIKTYIRWLVGREYLSAIEDSKHLEGEDRLMYELHTLSVLNKLCKNTLGNSFAKQIEKNQRFKMFRKMETPKERYKDIYDFENDIYLNAL